MALAAAALAGLLAAAAPAEQGTGSVAGTVTLAGKPPRSRPVPMDADPHCLEVSGRKVPQQDVVVGRDGGLANVLVRLEGEGLAAAAGAVPAELVEIEQRGCIYYPRVTGARVGQTLRVHNLDDTIHNVRSLSKAGHDFNVGQPKSGMQFDHKLAREEVLELRCDIHPWMRAYIGIAAHPWFTVTGENGRFELAGVPPGDYTVWLWHERFGERRKRVSVEAGGEASLELSLGGG